MYRSTVGIVVLWKNKILFGKAFDMRNNSITYFNMPQGGIDDGETPLEAAKRELLEEMGIKNVRWTKESEWFLLKFPEDLLYGRYEGLLGQKHKWFLAECSEEPTISLCTQEFHDYVWMCKNKLPNFCQDI